MPNVGTVIEQKYAVLIPVLVWLGCARQAQPSHAAQSSTVAAHFSVAHISQPDDEQWTMAARDYQNTQFSALNQINSNNANQLKPAWTLATFSPQNNLLYIPHQNVYMDEKNIQANSIAGMPFTGISSSSRGCPSLPLFIYCREGSEPCRIKRRRISSGLQAC